MNFKNINELKQAWLDGKLTGSLYAGKLNGDNKKSVGLITSNQGFSLLFHQDNDWTRIEEYLYDPEEDTWAISELYER